MWHIEGNYTKYTNRFLVSIKYIRFDFCIDGWWGLIHTYHAIVYEILGESIKVSI
jgi:hypothetical protein